VLAAGLANSVSHLLGIDTPNLDEREDVLPICLDGRSTDVYLLFDLPAVVDQKLEWRGWKGCHVILLPFLEPEWLSKGPSVGLIFLDP